MTLNSQRCETLIQMGRCQRVLADARECLKIAPDATVLHFRVLCALTALGRYEKARALFGRRTALGNWLCLAPSAYAVRPVPGNWLCLARPASPQAAVGCRLSARNWLCFASSALATPPAWPCPSKLALFGVTGLQLAYGLVSSFEIGFVLHARRPARPPGWPRPSEIGFVLHGPRYDSSRRSAAGRQPGIGFVLHARPTSPGVPLSLGLALFGIICPRRIARHPGNWLCLAFAA